MSGEGIPGGIPPKGLVGDELELVGRLVARALLSTGSGEGPVQSDEVLYGNAIGAMVSTMLGQVSAASGMEEVELFAAAFGGTDPHRLTRQELLDAAAVRVELILRGVI